MPLHLLEELGDVRRRALPVDPVAVDDAVDEHADLDRLLHLGEDVPGRRVEPEIAAGPGVHQDLLGVEVRR